MATELSKHYDPTDVEARVTELWRETNPGAAIPDEREDRYVIMMPLPNVTGALHMGHAMDNVMQDLLIRWHRLAQDNSLWMAGTDHAGIATQAVVEKRLFELEGKTRHDIGREALVKRIWEWKEQFQSRIVRQQQAMGCSCDWERQRFTMDAVCARAVRYTFFRMFQDGLIYRGDRLVNWDCHLQTAVADDEIAYETVDGHFWHLRYPIVDPKPGEPEHIVVATTRPETMLGDTAVAVHPDPEKQLKQLLAEARDKIAKGSAKERPAAQAELERLEARISTHLPPLIQLRDMAKDGRKVRLPLMDREIPIILDDWAKPELGSGCVKITPGHDPNDHEVWKRHEDEIGLINILEEDGSMNANAGAYQGLDRFDARKKVVADMDAQGLLESVEERKTEVGHSDRSKTPIEPFVSKQWFVHMDDVDGGIVCGRGTAKEFKTAGLAQAAIDAASGDWKSPTGRKLDFHPDERYTRTYLSWLSEKRDWCISRQLWWGHRIPIWAKSVLAKEVAEWTAKLEALGSRDDVAIRISRADGTSAALAESASLVTDHEDEKVEILACLLDRPTDEAVAKEIEALGLVRDPDVLDTWFSSGLWPHSTLGWPDPETAQIDEGQLPLASQNGQPNTLDYYYPGSCLVTGRDIITLWVARMVLMGLYNLGDLPFTDCFIHANILDGKGVKMSKSKGNGIDPVDIIEKYGADAMRYVLCELQTGSQDIRLPVQAISPYTGNLIDLAEAKHGSTMFTYVDPESGKEFDVLGTMEDVPAAKLVSDRFEVGRNFCNKLWNASRFAFMNLEDVEFRKLSTRDLEVEDRWILSRLSRAVREVDAQLREYNPAAAISAARDFFWSELCDWYLEFVKPRFRSEDDTTAAQVVAFALDQVLRLLHPFVPFITEELWAKLRELAPSRGIDAEVRGAAGLLAVAQWPAVRDDWEDEALEEEMDFAREVIRSVRDIRAKYTVPPSQPLDVIVRGPSGRVATLEKLGDLVRNLARLESLEARESVERAKDAAVAIVGDAEVFVAGVIDLEKEKARLTKEREQLVKRIEGSRKKLGNENFVSRAKPEVVEKERERLTELEGQLSSVETNLTALGDA